MLCITSFPTGSKTSPGVLQDARMRQLCPIHRTAQAFRSVPGPGILMELAPPRACKSVDVPGSSGGRRRLEHKAGPEMLSGSVKIGRRWSATVEAEFRGICLCGSSATELRHGQSRFVGRCSKRKKPGHQGCTSSALSCLLRKTVGEGSTGSYGVSATRCLPMVVICIIPQTWLVVKCAQRVVI